MPELTIFHKDPDAVLDYVWDWTSWLGGDDSITAHTVTTPAVDDGVTIDSSTVDGGKVTVWLSGGTARQAYDVTCRIVTAGGRTDERTSRFRVQER